MRKSKSIDAINNDEMWMNVDRIMCGGSPVVLIDRAAFAPDILRERIRTYDPDTDTVEYKVARYYKIDTVRGMDVITEMAQEDIESQTKTTTE